jgi:Fe-S-cluster containining protein
MAGKIPAHHLLTIREGEPAYDNIRELILPAASDIIKIKSAPGSRACRYFDPSAGTCRIYAARPLECRVLQCWDTRAIEKVYALARLTRRDLLSQVKGLWELVCDHQRRCRYDRIRQYAVTLRQGRSRNTEPLAALLDYDTHLRVLLTEQRGVPPGQMDFLLGRPLAETLEMFGLRVVWRAGKRMLVPCTDFVGPDRLAGRARPESI